MIKVSKDLTDIPKTLIKGTTLSKRNGVIAKRIFPKSNINSSDKEKKEVKKYEDRFRTKDIKDSLENIYNKKCAYCEQEVTRNSAEQTDDKSTVEHYRPKSKYYWLAYSWDNLLWCCYGCNKSKGNNFEILGNSVHLNSKSDEESFKENIHSSNLGYQDEEDPKMIHPEIESVVDKLSFYDGVIKSDDKRVKYTIETCGIDRKVLNEKRQTIIKKIINRISKEAVFKKSDEDSLKEIRTNLMIDIKEKNKDFIALRSWLLINHKTLFEAQT